MLLYAIVAAFIIIVALKILGVAFQILGELLLWVGPAAAIYVGYNLSHTIHYHMAGIWLMVIGCTVILIKVMD